MARAEFTLDQRTDEGGRLTPFYTNYRPNIAFGGGQPMKCEFFTEQEGGHKPGTVGEIGMRSEEHTSELQSLMRSSYAVFCLKQKTTTQQITRLNKKKKK